MKILVIGSGGREHALAASFARHNSAQDIIVMPGNSGIAREFNCVPIGEQQAVLDWCVANRPEFVVIGPEQPLAEGLVDLLTRHGIPCVGPTQDAARIETSKVFAKQLMQSKAIPTAQYQGFSSLRDAREYLISDVSYPSVIKADGLAAGKGVFVCQDRNEAEAALDELQKHFGTDCDVLIEEYLSGWEVSLFAVTDGEAFQTMLFVQDYKQLNDGDTGPNTGGMGAVCPIKEAEPYRREIEKNIIGPILEAMTDEGCPFSGFLYCGLMITEKGPKVLEFNCRLGDPETQAILPLLKTPLAEVCTAVTNKEVARLKLEWWEKSSICVVLSSRGYPQAPEKGQLLEITPGLQSRIFFSGVADRDGNLVTNGGRVLALVATGGSLAAAKEQIYNEVTQVSFSGRHFRKDISQRNNAFYMEHA